MRRPSLTIAAGFGVFVFLGLSFLLARGLTGSGAERGKVLAVLEAQASGDAAAVLERLPACRDEPACAQVTRARVERLERPGAVQILNYLRARDCRSRAAPAPDASPGARARACPSSSAYACAARDR